MDPYTKVQLIKEFAAEIVTEEELERLFETKEHPIAYDGFEPSGLAHLAFGVLRPLILERLLSMGVHFKLYLADWFAWINHKLGGDLEKIKQCGHYFLEVWKAAGVDLKRVKVVWASELVKDPEYWKRVILIAKSVSLARANRALTIMGRKAGEMKEVAQYFYPMMQVADVFHMQVDICQLGLDQRRANMLARELGPKLGWWKPVIVSHPMLMGLEGLKRPEGYDEDASIDAAIASKMSKSKPSSCIFVHDSAEQIRAKIRVAFCPPKEVLNNPVLHYAKLLIFKKFPSLLIERPQGSIEVQSYGELEKLYRQGEIHPLDLKNAIAEKIEELVRPIREHFERCGKARELYELVKQAEVTR